MLGLRGCSWWSLETDLSLKPPCPVMSPVKGLLAAWELHRMLTLAFHTHPLHFTLGNFLPLTPSA